MKTLFALALLCLSLSARSEDKLIYRMVSLSRFEGQGAVNTAQVKGVLLWNPTTNEVHSVGAAKLNKAKLLVVQKLEGYLFKTGSIPGRSFTVMAKAVAPRQDLPAVLLESQFAKGINSLFNIAGKQYTVPKVMPWTTRIITEVGGGAVQTTEGKGRYTLDLSATLSSNVSGESLLAARERYRQQFIAEGFAQIQ